MQCVTPSVGTRHLFQAQRLLPIWLNLDPAYKRGRRLFEGGFYSRIYGRFYCLSLALSHLACLGPTCLSSSFQLMFISLVLTQLFPSHLHSDLCFSFSFIFFFAFRGILSENTSTILSSDTGCSAHLSLSCFSLSFIGKLAEDTSTVMLSRWWHVYHYTWSQHCGPL